ncbi:hypothetical protein COBT_000512 [Conglomerata obtusa]
MKILNKTDLAKILHSINTHNYKQAFDLTETLLLQKITDSRLDLLHLYLLTELDKYEEALAEIENVNSHSSYYFVRLIYKNLNLLEQYKQIANEDLHRYEACMLSYDYKAAKSFSLSLVIQNCNYTLFATICIMLHEHINFEANILLFKTLFEKFLRQNSNKISCQNFLFLIEKKIIGKQWDKYIDFCQNDNVVMFLILKNIIINEYIDETNFKAMNLYLENNFADQCKKNADNLENTKEVLANIIINFIDDGDVYEYCINNKIPVKFKDTSNYQEYILKTTKNVQIAKKIIEKSIYFKEIGDIVNLVNTSIYFESKGHNIHMKYIYNEITNDDIKEAYGIYVNNKSIYNTKLILTLLISSKIENNLILALKIALDEKDTFSSTYEIKLILMFLYRFFCWYDKVIEIYKELDVKTILNESLAYVWSDLLIKFKIEDNNQIYMYKEYNKHIIKNINSSFLLFIQNDSFYHGYELLETKKKLENSLTEKEIDANTIFSDCKQSHFSNLLGSGSSYLFDKLIFNSQDRYPELQMSCIFCKKEPNKFNLHENEICTIIDQNFFAHIEELIIYREKIFANIK